MNQTDVLFDNSLQFYYEDGAISSVFRGAIAPWRTMPWANIAHVTGGRWKIERENDGEFFVESGEAVCFPAGVRHRSFMESVGQSEARWAHFNVFLCGLIDLLSFFDVPPIFRGDAAARLGEILGELGQLEENGKPFTQLLERKVREFELATILINHSQPRYGGELRLQQIQRVLPVLKAMADDPTAPHSRTSLAKLAHLSPSRFAALFKEAVGVAPIDYLLRLRMRHARQLLPGSDLTIEQIAAAVGYSDAFYFSRLFKARFGVSPKKYRDAMRRGEL